MTAVCLPEHGAVCISIATRSSVGQLQVAGSRHGSGFKPRAPTETRARTQEHTQTETVSATDRQTDGRTDRPPSRAWQAAQAGVAGARSIAARPLTSYVGQDHSLSLRACSVIFVTHAKDIT